jgi:hypothetical protein
MDCHRDPHGGQFANAPFGNRCEECHTVDSFQPSTFSLSRHQTASFALSGAHVAVACLDCHHKEGAPAGADLQFHFASALCEDCHHDPHGGDYPENMKSQMQKGRGVCERCHGLRSWRQLKTFDHSTTGFPLAGEHASLACTDCHRLRDAEAGIRQIPFQSAPKRCAGCHEDIHAGQFQRGGEMAACSDCHTAARWAAATFDHNKGTSFSLKGAHADVPCRLCHTQRRTVNGRSVVMYKDTPIECTGCHR